MRWLSALSLLWAISIILPTTFASFSSARNSVAARADDDGQNATFSSFVQNTSQGNISFAVTAVKQMGDLYFHLEAPSESSWVSVGTGSDMAGSLMWIVYANKDKNGITLSPRTVDGHVEPSYSADIPCNITSHTGSDGSPPAGIASLNGKKIFTANVLCLNVNNRSNFRRSLSLDRRNDELDVDGKINFDSTAQPFIFALGPPTKEHDLASDSPSAGVRRHAVYGSFTLDLKAATVQTSNDFNQEALATVGNWAMKGGKLTDGPEDDRDWSESLHAVAMCGTYVILFPIGVVFLRVMEKVVWHAVMQSVGVLAIIIGVGLGFYLGREYNHAKDVKSAHQIIGLLVAASTLIQFGLGLSHHLIYRRTQRSTLLGKIHLYLGPLILLVGAANGFLGFQFSDAPRHNILYGVLVGVVFVLLVGILFWAARRRKARIEAEEGSRMQGDSYEAFRDQDERGRMVGASDDQIPLRTVPSEEPPPYQGVRGVSPRPMV